MTAGTRKAGDFCWINMLTPDPAQAREFFAALLGWTYNEMPGVGHSIQVDGHNIGGLFDVHGPNTPSGTLPCIGIMVKVDSADAAVEKFNALGGRAKPAFDIGPQGRMADCFDPIGANIDVWETRKMAGTDADSRHHGVPTWFELNATDTAAATSFYTAMFGWTATAAPVGNMEYTSFSLDGVAIAGMLPITSGIGINKPFWGVYFTVNSTDETVRLATTLGATIGLPARDIPGTGRFAGITSPQGITFFVIQYL